MPRHRLHTLIAVLVLAAAWIMSPGTGLELAPPGHLSPWQELANVRSQRADGKTLFLDCQDFAVWFDPATRNPALVAHKLREHRWRNRSERPHWHRESQLPPELQVHSEEYESSGYDRGHLAPMADMDAPESEAATFTLANAIPQEPTFNRGAWSALEREVRDLVAAQTRGRSDQALVFTGPVYDPDRPARFLPDSRVRIPDGCFKVLALQGNDESVDAVRVWLYWADADEAECDASVRSLAELRLVTGVELDLPMLQAGK